MKEFELIRTYFQSQFEGLVSNPGTITRGIGDDCAILAESSFETVVSTDTSVSGRHFPDDCPARVVAARSLGSAVSDLAAMGAKPLAYTMALSMPGYDKDWLAGFSSVLLNCSIQWQIPLIGGDTVRGPLMVTMTVMGRIRKGRALLRSGADIGDDIWVSGSLGDAAGGFQVLSERTGINLSEDHLAYLINRYEAPQPRLKLGQYLSGRATSAIDVSDGLLADLGHITDCSGLGAHVEVADIPVSQKLEALLGQENALQAALAGGDDYELCFTAPPGMRPQLFRYTKEQQLNLARIGVMTSGTGVKVFRNGQSVAYERGGFDHFA